MLCQQPLPTALISTMGHRSNQRRDGQEGPTGCSCSSGKTFNQQLGKLQQGKSCELSSPHQSSFVGCFFLAKAGTVVLLQRSHQ